MMGFQRPRARGAEKGVPRAAKNACWPLPSAAAGRSPTIGDFQIRLRAGASDGDDDLDRRFQRGVAVDFLSGK
jgi:hypothetical protein